MKMRTLIKIVLIIPCVIASGVLSCLLDRDKKDLGGYWANLYDWSDIAEWTDPTTWPDDKLRSFVYSRQTGHPEFYQEDYSRGSPYYENTVSIRTGTHQWIELCTNDHDSALVWSEYSSSTSSYYRELESELETEKYFEFRRVYAEYPSDVILSRVHKCTYLDRSMYDAFNPTQILGVYKVRPITSSGARELIEYMWSNWMIVRYGRPVTRDLTETEAEFIEEIYYLYMIIGDWDVCDTVHLEVSRVHLDKVTGEVTWEWEAVRKVTGVCD